MTSANDRLTKLNRDYIMDMAKRKRLESNSTPTSNSQGSYNEYEDVDSWKSDKLTRLREVRERRKEYLQKGSGTLELITDEKSLVEASKRFPRVICHFYEDGFVRCERLDGLLETLASSFVDTKFVKIRASKAPFFTMKFGIKVLPTLLTLIEGTVSKIFIGFQEFSGDNINLNILRNTLLSHNILTNELTNLMRTNKRNTTAECHNSVFFDIFTSVSNGANRIPLKAALNALNSFFNSPANPYRVHMGNDSMDFKLSSEDFMDQFYSRHVDKRHGLRSQILMVGGPKNLRGNPRGPTDAMLSFPQDMECIFLEKILPGSCAAQITGSCNTKEFQKIQLKENKRCLEALKPPG